MNQDFLQMETLNSSLWKNISIIIKNFDNLNDILPKYQFHPPAILIRIVLTIFLRIGFLFVQIGTVPVTNVNLILLQNLVDFSWTTLVYFLVGFIFSCSGDSNNALIGGEHWIGETNINKTEALIGWQTVSITSAISTSGVIGRLHTVGSLMSTMLLSGVLQPLIIYWSSAPNGWMIKNTFLKKEVFFKDHSGAAVIHVVGGLVALIGCITLGRRILKLKDIDKSSIPFSSPAIVFAGYFFIFLGLQGVSSVYILEKMEQVLLNNLLAASSSALMVIIVHFLRNGHFSDYWKVTRCIQGAISGLVAVSATPDFYSPFLSILFGSFSGLIFYIVSEIIFKSALEDNCNIISIHLISGFLGSLLAPFSTCKLMNGKSIWIDIMWQANCLFVMMIIVTVIMAPIFSLLKICGCLRNRSEFLNHMQSSLALKNGPIKYSMQRIFSQGKKNTFINPGCVSNLSQINLQQSFLELAQRNNFLRSQNESCELIEECEIGTDIIQEKNGQATEQVVHLKNNLEMQEREREEPIDLKETILLITDDKPNAKKRPRESNTPTNVKRKKPAVSLLEKSLFAWFKQRMASGESISNPLLKETALIINESTKEKTNFKDSVAGWLKGFRDRNSIQILSLGERISDLKANENFSKELCKVIKEENYSLDQIYNCDECALFWKSMPNESDEAKDRVSFILCANASGTHKIPLFLIGKSNCCMDLEAKDLPVDFASQQNALVDSELFLHWYKNIFLPSIREFHRSKTRSERVLVILDNAVCHCSKEELEAIDDICNVRFLPTNISAHVQPMTQGISVKVKRLYRKNCLQDLVSGRIKGVVRNLVKQKEIPTLCFQLKNAWDSIKKNTLRQAWQNLLPEIRFEQEISDTTQHQFLQILNRIPGYEKSSLRDLSSWLVEDDKEQGWQILDELEIVNSIIRIGKETIVPEVIFLEECATDPLIEAMEALKGLETFRKWFENRLEYEPEDFLALQRLTKFTKDVVAKNN